MPTLMPTMPPSVRRANSLRKLAALGVDHGAVGKAVVVHDLEPFFEAVHALDAEHGTKDLFPAARHIFGHVIEDRGSNEEALFAFLRDLGIAPVQNQLGALLDGGLDAVQDELLVSLVDDGAHAGLLVVGRAQVDLFRKARHGFDQLVGHGVLHDHHGKSHAALAGASAEGVDDALRGALDDRIAQHQGVVLGLGERLHALAVAAAVA